MGFLNIFKRDKKDIVKEVLEFEKKVNDLYISIKKREKELLKLDEKQQLIEARSIVNNIKGLFSDLDNIGDSIKEVKNRIEREKNWDYLDKVYLRLKPLYEKALKYGKQLEEFEKIIEVKENVKNGSSN